MTSWPFPSLLGPGLNLPGMVFSRKKPKSPARKMGSVSSERSNTSKGLQPTGGWGQAGGETLILCKAKEPNTSNLSLSLGLRTDLSELFHVPPPLSLCSLFPTPRPFPQGPCSTPYLLSIHVPSRYASIVPGSLSPESLVLKAPTLFPISYLLCSSLGSSTSVLLTFWTRYFSV